MCACLGVCVRTYACTFARVCRCGIHLKKREKKTLKRYFKKTSPRIRSPNHQTKGARILLLLIWNSFLPLLDPTPNLFVTVTCSRVYLLLVVSLRCCRVYFYRLWMSQEKRLRVCIYVRFDVCRSVYVFLCMDGNKGVNMCIYRDATFIRTYIFFYTSVSLYTFLYTHM